MNHELPDVQARFRKGRGTRDQIANILPPEKTVCRSGSLELDMEKQTGSKWGKEYVKAVYCHTAF